MHCTLLDSTRGGASCRLCAEYISPFVDHKPVLFGRTPTEAYGDFARAAGKALLPYIKEGVVTEVLAVFRSVLFDADCLHHCNRNSFRSALDPQVSCGIQLTLPPTGPTPGAAPFSAMAPRPRRNWRRQPRLLDFLISAVSIAMRSCNNPSPS